MPKPFTPGPVVTPAQIASRFASVADALSQPIVQDWGTLAANKTLDIQIADANLLILGASITLTLSKTAVPDRTRVRLYLSQDSTGSRLVTWSGVTWLSGSAPTLNTAANALDVLEFVYDAALISWLGSPLYTGVAAKLGHSLTAGTHLSGGPFDGSAAVTLTTDATSANTSSTIMARGASGEFSAGVATVSAVASGTSPATAGALRTPNGTANGLQARNAAGTGDVRLLDLDGSNIAQLGAGAASIATSVNVAIADTKAITGSGLTLLKNNGGNVQIGDGANNLLLVGRTTNPTWAAINALAVGGRLGCDAEFGCNGNTPQGKAVSGGTLAGVIAALVANGILSS